MKLCCDFDEAFVDVECGKHFVPFAKGEAERIELCAIAAKRCLGVSDGEALDPWEAAKNVGIEVRGADYLSTFPAKIRRQTLDAGSACWSAGTILKPPKAVVILNPVHDEVRRRTTLAEELAHIVMGHPPSRIDPANGLRTYDDDVEGEAYGVGGAMIVPYNHLFPLVDRGATESQIARKFLVSKRFILYRVNRAGLRRLYIARQRSRTPTRA